MLKTTLYPMEFVTFYIFHGHVRAGNKHSRLERRLCMVQTSKTDHFFKLAPFWSPLTDLIDFAMAGMLLTSATGRCSPFVDSVLRT